MAADKPEVLWKRAIDRDDAKIIWQMLPDSDPKITNDKGKTALMAAAKLGDQELLEALLQRGLTLADRSFTGGTALMYATLGNQHQMMNYLLAQSSGDDLDAQSTNGWTAVMIAAAKGFNRALKTLVDQGANPWLADAYQWSPLMRAIDNQHLVVVRYLLSLSDPPVNFQNENGSTALHVAVLKKDIETTRMLVALKARRDITDDNGLTAVDIARHSGADNLLALLDD